MCFKLSKNTNLGLAISSLIFGVVALVHACRLLMGFSISFNGQELPMFVSVIGLLVTGFMSYWLWTLRSPAS